MRAQEQGGLGVLDQLRYVGVSAGSLRFVDTYRRGGAPNKVTVWTLRDPDATEWTLEHQATFADVWADDTYKATGLPKTAPVLALIHPHNPAVVYSFLEDHLFAVDVPARKVVDCERYHLVAPPREYGIANRFVRDWELPRAVSSGIPCSCVHASSSSHLWLMAILLQNYIMGFPSCSMCLLWTHSLVNRLCVSSCHIHLYLLYSACSGGRIVSWIIYC
jgi:hypothetical protein